MQANIEGHKLLLNSEVTVASISDAYAAHSLALKEYEANQEHREQQQFESLKTSLGPHLYDNELEHISERSCRNTNQWVYHEDVVRKWCSCSEDIVPILWLNGIPGAGKLSHIDSPARVLTSFERKIAFVGCPHPAYDTR